MEENVAREIKDLRLDMGISQEEFAHKVGVTLMTVHRWESGKTKPHKIFVTKIRKIAKGYRGHHEKND